MDGESINKHFRKKQEFKRISGRKLLYISIIKDWVFHHKVLDIGCGDGLIASWLTPVCNIVGCDLEVDKLKKSYKRIEFLKDGTIQRTIKGKRHVHDKKSPCRKKTAKKGSSDNVKKRKGVKQK